MLEILNTITISFPAPWRADEFAVAAFVHPSFAKIPDSAHAAAANSSARILGSYMPFWYALVLMLSIADAVITWRYVHEWDKWILASCVLWVIAIVSTIIWLVPINNRVASWTPESLPSDWREDRKRWDRLHRWRTLLLFVASASLIVGVLHSH
jgi:Anthrone oxygenase